MALNPVTDSVGVAVEVSGAGDHVLVAGHPGKVIKVFRIVLTLTTPDDNPIDLQFKSGTTDLNGPIQLYSGGAITLELNQRRWLMTWPGEDLIVNLSGAGRLTGGLTVVIEDE